MLSTEQLTDWSRSLRQAVYRRPALCLMTAASMVMLPAALNRGLQDWDEAIYASVAREIYRTGEWVALEFSGGPYFNKPPAYMLLVAACYSLIGISEFAARFPAVLFSVGYLVLGYDLMRRLSDRPTALLAMLLLLGSHSFLDIATHGRMESMVSFFILLSLYALWRSSEHPLWNAVFWIGIGLGCFTKGPMGVVPVVVAVPWWWTVGGWRRWYGSRWFWIGVVLGGAIGAGWYIAAWWSLGEPFVERSFHREMMERTIRPIEGHVGGVLFHLKHVTLDSGTLWGYLVPFALGYGVHRWWVTACRASLFLVLYATVPFLIFALVQTKITWYVFCAYVPLATMVASLLRAGLQRPPWRWASILVVLGSLWMMLDFGWHYRKPRGQSLSMLTTAFADAVPAGECVGSIDIGPSLVFYADRPTRSWESLDRVEPGKRGSRWIAMSVDVWDPDTALANGFNEVARSERHVLLRSRP